MDEHVRNALHTFADQFWLSNDGALKQIYVLGVPEADIRARCQAIGLDFSEADWAEWLNHRVIGSEMELGGVRWVVHMYGCSGTPSRNDVLAFDLSCRHHELFTNCDNRKEMLDQVEFVAKKAARLGRHLGAGYTVMATGELGPEAENPFAWPQAFVVQAYSNPHRVMD
ncbi:MAG: hypothetical protein IBJ18_12875 [Phycisphaerales bacterium]|nr:hypothetical protein [Phycisphaerales bacterium]